MQMRGNNSARGLDFYTNYGIIPPMECLKCKKYFKNKLLIEGKLRNLNNRRYCFDCSPFGAHNTRRLHLRKGDELRKCQKCGKEYPRARHQPKNVCGSCYTSDFRIKLKKDIVAMFGGCCQVCGYSRCVAALEFHHLDPSKKEIQISGSTKNREKIIQEAKKCLLVCVRCHREIHSGVVQWQNNRLLTDESQVRPLPPEL